MSGYLKHIHPVLPVKNVTQAIRYYTEKLGFRLAFKDEGDNPNYGGVIRDGIEIHLQWHDEKEWEVTIDRPLLRIYVDHIEALFDEYKTKDIFHDRTSLKETTWGTREFGFYDLYGNGLVFYLDL
ncbi:VOC family protein [uncultured Psychroserpens sp.]|uniref:VOC family protein n=1 Tax=uncultured Psychroserpens sp. TaxID=255436 RepID=UPI00263487BB|nr:VOC family protein [uncultured Psychroserpens sp.]